MDRVPFVLPFRASLISLVAAVGIVLSACGGNPVTDANQDVEYVPCSETECSGTLPSGAEFEILMPDGWGGTLAIYSQATPFATAAAPDASALPQPAPMWDQGDESVADTLLSAKYAVAGATPQSDGWSVADQITAARELYEYFEANVAAPNRVYAWGKGTGGLTSARLAELYPDWVSGAAPICAPMSGPIPTFTLALDVAYAVKELVYPKFKIVDFKDAAEAQKNYNEAAKRVADLAASGKSADQATVIMLGAVGNLPDQTRTIDGATISSKVSAYQTGVTNLLRQATIGGQQFAATVGGNPASNEQTNYAKRPTPTQVGQMEELAPGQAQKQVKKLNAGERISAQEEAVTNAKEQGQLTGELSVPVLSLHNSFDPVFIGQNQSWYRSRTKAVGEAEKANFIDLFVLPPVSYTADQPAPEGAGNCNFSTRTVIGLMIQLNDWVRRDQYPGRDTVSKAFEDSQVTISFRPGPWPAMDVSPETLT